MRGRDGPVRSTSSKPTFADGSFARRESASWTLTDDFPTPPFPESTRRTWRIWRSRVMSFSSAAAGVDIKSRGQRRKRKGGRAAWPELRLGSVRVFVGAKSSLARRALVLPFLPVPIDCGVPSRLRCSSMSVFRLLSRPVLPSLPSTSCLKSSLFDNLPGKSTFSAFLRTPQAQHPDFLLGQASLRSGQQQNEAEDRPRTAATRSESVSA